METEVDVDLIKDEQNPMYQNINIQRQQLISVLDRSLQKICIAYVLEEILTKHIPILQQYITQKKLDSILALFKYARRLEECSGSIKSTINRTSTFVRSGNAKSTAKTISMDLNNIQDQDKGNSSYSQIIKNYYSTLIAKLHSIPEITNLAETMVLNKPKESIKYYVYMKDFRDQVVKMIYQTKTDEVNQEKKIKLAYVRNLKEIPQVATIVKIMEDKQKEKEKVELHINSYIEKEKEIQAKMDLQLNSVANDMIIKSEDEILTRMENNHMIQEVNKVKYAERLTYYNKQLDEDLKTVLILRKRNRKHEVNFRKILDEYDNTIGSLHESFEIINEGFLKVEALYNDVKMKFDNQVEIYEELMEERDQYIEMNLLRISYNRATRIIQAWWRNILLKRWKWRKTFLANQLKRIQTPEQKAKLKKLLKLAIAKQKKQNKKILKL